MPDKVIIEFGVAGFEDLTKAESALDKITQSGTEMGTEFKKNSDAINAGIKQQTVSLGALQKAEQDLIAIQKSSTQPEILKQVNAQLEKVRAEMKAAGSSADSLSKDFKKVKDAVNFEAGKKTLEEFGKKINEATTKSQKLTTQLRAMKQQLNEMELAGKGGTKAFNDLLKSAAKLEDQIGDTSRRVRALASDTKNIDAVVGVVSGLAGAFSAAQGASALLGDENEDLQKSLLKVQAAMAIATGVQQVANTLQKDSAVSVALNSAAQRAYAIVVGTSTGALKAFRIALAATGIGLIIIAVGSLIANFDKLKEKVLNIFPGLAHLGELWDEVKVKAFGFFNAVIEGLSKTGKIITDVFTLKFADALEEIKTFTSDVGKAFEAGEIAERASIAADKAKEATELTIKELSRRIALLDAAGKDSYNLRKQQLTLELSLLENSTKEEKELYKDKQNEIQVLTVAHNKFLADQAKKSNEDLKKIKFARDGVGEGIPGDVSSFPEVVLAEDIEKFKTFIAKRGKEARLVIAQEEVQEELKLKQQLLQTSIEFGNQLFSFGAALNAQQQQNLEDRLKAGTISEKKYAEEIAKLKRKQAIADKEAAAFNIIINTATAIAKVAGQTGILAIILSAAIAALGAAQLATVLAQPIPKFAKGEEMIKGGIPGKDSIHALLMPGERIVPAHINKQLMGIKNADLPKLLIPEMPYISDSTMTAMEKARGINSTGAMIDYDKLAEKVATKMGQEMKRLPKHNVKIDKDGLEIMVEEGNTKRKYWDNYYSYNG